MRGIKLDATTGETTTIDIKSYRDIQAGVGGTFDVAFTERVGGSHCITGYVHDEGLLIGLPITYAFRYRNGYVQPYAGDVVLSGLDDATGDTAPLTDADLKRVRVSEPMPVVVGGVLLLVRIITVR